MTDQSRTQGWAICVGAGVLGLLFLIGILDGSYLALAIPVAILTFFALGLAAWVGYTIATIRVETETEITVHPTTDASTEPASDASA